MCNVNRLYRFAILLAVLVVCPGLAAAQRVDLGGNHLLKNGKVWVPKGVVIVGMVAPQSDLKPRFRAAHAHFGDAELRAIRDYGADLIRFQVSQAGCDPSSSLFSPDYMRQVVQAVRQARASGFDVIVSMQSRRASGIQDPNGLPGDGTRRAWHQLAHWFASDSAVMLELFNEPSRTRYTDRIEREPTWDDWKKGFQPVIDQIRADGVHNILILDGLQWAHLLSGAPDMSDPDRKIAYAVHSYPKAGYETPADWDKAFGSFARTHPVIATEWNARAVKHCTEDMPSVASSFLAYARARQIGVVGWAFDLPDTLFDENGRLTTFRNFSCDMTAPSGVGELLHTYFKQRTE
jgi:endoglucanase